MKIFMLILPLAYLLNSCTATEHKHTEKNNRLELIPEPDKDLREAYNKEQANKLYGALSDRDSVTLNRPRAEKAVKDYMSTHFKDYKPGYFGEFFSQYYSENLQNLAKTKEVIQYSIVHTYYLKKKKSADTYFHLNSSYQVIGMNTMEEMTKMVISDLKNSPVFDSIMKSIEQEMKSK